MKTIFPMMALVAAAFLAGCETPYELAMNPAKNPVVDDSATVSEVPKYKRIMVVPPAGRARGESDIDLSNIERELMRNGVTLLSAGLTQDDASPRTAADSDRVYAAAKAANADAILEIGMFGTSRATERNLGARFFVPEGFGTIREIGDGMQRMVLLKSGNRPFIETDEASYAKLGGDQRPLGRYYEDEVMEFSGRLVDVKTREIVASLHYYVPGVRCGRPYFEVIDAKGKTTAEAYDWAAEEARRMRRAAARKAVVKTLAERMAGDR